MTLAYYFDEDTMRRKLIMAVRLRGLDVVSPSDAGMIHRLDEEHLDYATEHGRVVYRFNVGDFCHLHRE